MRQWVREFAATFLVAFVAIAAFMAVIWGVMMMIDAYPLLEPVVAIGCVAMLIAWFVAGFAVAEDDY